ncbi:hypothetical protein [Pseudonocardia sp. Ae717_Ps2]|uniref:hypothetical protein n=1 Tax=Pseudonocardia sp. Ae717_Ps2 TaxID=1885573 RepID=UPI00117B6580|nr:hypothetical protein [Pseudonocardia sp. Ae717_Ps2]
MFVNDVLDYQDLFTYRHNLGGGGTAKLVFAGSLRLTLMNEEQGPSFRSWIVFDDEEDQVLEVAAGVEARARRLAEGVLRDLGLTALGWEVRGVFVASPSPVSSPRPGLEMGTDLAVEIDSGRDVSGAFVAESVAVHFTTSVAHEVACVATAEQIQDRVLELECGVPRPTCPRHPHPLMPRMVEGVPSWECPRDPSHYSVPMSGT